MQSVKEYLEPVTKIALDVKDQVRRESGQCGTLTRGDSSCVKGERALVCGGSEYPVFSLDVLLLYCTAVELLINPMIVRRDQLVQEPDFSVNSPYN